MSIESFSRKCYPVKTNFGGNSRNVSLECESCGAVEHDALKKSYPPDFIKQKFRKSGWQLRPRVSCPECSKKKESKAMNKVNTLAVKPATEKEAPDVTLRKNKRLVLLTLEDCYNETNGRYADGNSDESVSRELGLSVAFIKSVREEFYGKMSEPTEVQALRESLDKATKDIATIMQNLDALCRKNGW